MPEYRKLSGARAVTVVGLVAGGAGIAIQWASGVEFPVAIAHPHRNTLYTSSPSQHLSPSTRVRPPL